MSAKLLAVLLGYPDEALLEAVPELRAAAAQLERSRRRALEPLLDALAGTPLADLRRSYVETFDFDRRCGLHLTYHTHGDRRQRGEFLQLLEDQFDSLFPHRVGHGGVVTRNVILRYSEGSGIERRGGVLRVRDPHVRVRRVGGGHDRRRPHPHPDG